MDVKRITPEQAKELLDQAQDYIYLDVRTVQEFDAGHVPGAKNIPLMMSAMGRMQMNPDFVEIVESNFGKEQKLIVGCQKGGTSLKATEMLRQGGREVMAYYLLKTEPTEYSFADLESDQTTIWDGVSNPVALKNLRNMKP